MLQKLASLVQFLIFAALFISVFRRWAKLKLEATHGQEYLATRALAWGVGGFALSNLLSLIGQFAWPGGAVPLAWSHVTTVLSLGTAYAFVAFATDFFPARRIIRSAALVATTVLATILFVEAPAVAVRGGHLVFSHVKNPIDYVLYLRVLIYWLGAVYAAIAATFFYYATQVSRDARARLLSAAAGTGLIATAVALVPFLLLQHLSHSAVVAYTNVIRVLAFLSGPLLYFGLARRRQ